MNHYKIGDHEIRIPQSWGEMSFETYLKLKELINGNHEEIDIISCISGVEKDVLISSQEIDNYIYTLGALEFIRHPINHKWTPPYSVKIKDKTIILPVDLGYETVGQLNDLREYLSKNLKDEIKEEHHAYAFAIYAQPLYDGGYNINKVNNFMNTVYDMPCDVVVNMGGFFLTKYLGLKNGFQKIVPRQNGMIRRFRLAIENLQRHLAFT